MKPLKFVIAFSLLCMAFAPDALLVHRLTVQPTSKLFIDGKTNFNSFTCAIAKYTSKDTLVLHEGGRNTRPVFVKGEVGLDAANFDCGLSMITSDFQKTIKAKEHPRIIIDFISFERTPSYQAEEKFKGIMKIALAGVVRVFEVNCVIQAQADGAIHLKGSRNFTFEDFQLTPPSHMFGAVKVKDEFNVSFHLVLELDPNR